MRIIGEGKELLGDTKTSYARESYGQSYEKDALIKLITMTLNEFANPPEYLNIPPNEFDLF
jgi:hypothetical protein